MEGFADIPNRESSADCPDCDGGTIHAFDGRKLANGFKCNSCNNKFVRNF